jgi:hypothetical protein
MHLRRAVALAAPLLLLSGLSPAAAQAPSPGWIADPGSGCRVWNPNPQPQGSIRWVGPLPGRFCRRPRRAAMVSRTTDGRYDGEMRDGKPHGRGVEISASSNRHDGEFRDGKVHGFGVYHHAASGRTL